MTKVIHMSTLPDHSTFKKIRSGGSPSGDNDPPSALDAIANDNKDTNPPQKHILAPSGSIEDPAVSAALAEGHSIRANGTVFQSGTNSA